MCCVLPFSNMISSNPSNQLVEIMTSWALTYLATYTLTTYHYRHTTYCWYYKPPLKERLNLILVTSYESLLAQICNLIIFIISSLLIPIGSTTIMKLWNIYIFHLFILIRRELLTYSPIGWLSSWIELLWIHNSSCVLGGEVLRGITPPKVKRIDGNIVVKRILVENVYQIDRVSHTNQLTWISYQPFINRFSCSESQHIYEIRHLLSTYLGTIN